MKPICYFACNKSSVAKIAFRMYATAIQELSPAPNFVDNEAAKSFSDEDSSVIYSNLHAEEGNPTTLMPARYSEITSGVVQI
jgi:hypothetical protein